MGTHSVFLDPALDDFAIAVNWRLTAEEYQARDLCCMGCEA